MRSALGAAVCLAIALAAPAAEAAQRYAAPDGAGTACSQAAPCSLNVAVGKAKANDEVIIASGAYSLSSSAFLPFEATGANVHGNFSGPPPTITASIPAYALGIFAPKARLSHVDVTNDAEFSAAIACGTDASVDRVAATSTAKIAVGLQQGSSCAVRDSLIRAEGSEGVALATSCEGPAIARNVTVIAPGAKSVGIRVSYGGFILSGGCTLNLKNAIVSGGQYDLQTLFGVFGAGNILVEHSSFDVVKQEPSTTITSGAGNQTAPALFVNAAGGDYREAPGSPTIDAGSADGLGPLDFAGNPRTLGTAPDIGAFEFVPPPAPVAAPGQLQSLSVKPKTFRTVNAGGAILSRTTKRPPSRKAPIGTTVGYGLSAPATTTFTVERAIKGRKVGKKCVKATRANRDRKRCTRYKPLKGSFTHAGTTGPNSFKFSGRISGKAPAPGAYRLIGAVGESVKRAAFRIAR